MPKEFAWKLLQVSIVTSVFCALLATFSKTIADPDIWGHVQFGLDILKSGSIVTVDPYSYLTAGTKWINHEWLAEIIFATAYKHGGVAGLCLLRMSLCLSMLVLIYYHLRRAKLYPVSASLILLLTGLMLVPTMVTLRPQLFTDFLLLAELLIIKEAEQKNYKWLFFMPIVFMLWANLHGGFLAGITCLSIWAFIHCCEKILETKSLSFLRSKAVLAPIAALLASWAALLANPYGGNLIGFLLSTATEARPDIPEWQPLPLFDGIGIAYLFSLALSLIALFRHHFKDGPKNLSITAIMLPVAFAPLQIRRHLQLFSISMAVLLADYFADLQTLILSKFSIRLHEPPKGIAALFIIVSAVLFVGSAALLGFTYRDANKLIVTQNYPFAACAVLKATGTTGNLAISPMAWGEFVIWRLQRQFKVSNDGRRETCYSRQIRQMNIDFDSGDRNWDKVLHQYPTDLALVSKEKPCFALLKAKPDWIMIYEDGIGGVFARASFAQAKHLHPLNPLQSTEAH